MSPVDQVQIATPTGVVLWQGSCRECGTGYGVLSAVPEEEQRPRFCPWCGVRSTAVVAQHTTVYPE